MYYVCIENDKIVSILNYLPSVPSSVRIVEITNEEGLGISRQTHFFDLESESVKQVNQSELDLKEIEKQNSVEREYLSSTDWMVLRHLRQKFLGLSTSLSEEEYRNLELNRQNAADRVVKI